MLCQKTVILIGHKHLNKRVDICEVIKACQLSVTVFRILMPQLAIINKKIIEIKINWVLLKIKIPLQLK